MMKRFVLYTKPAEVEMQEHVEGGWVDYGVAQRQIAELRQEKEHNFRMCKAEESRANTAEAVSKAANTQLREAEAAWKLERGGYRKRTSELETEVAQWTVQYEGDKEHIEKLEAILRTIHDPERSWKNVSVESLRAFAGEALHVEELAAGHMSERDEA